MLYEWDENKRQINLEKHGFDFADAWIVLENEASVTIDDIKHSQTEHRLMTIGLYDDITCVVIIHTDRNGTTRIISFRHANKKEEVFYGNSKIYN